MIKLGSRKANNESQATGHHCFPKPVKEDPATLPAFSAPTALILI